MTCEIRYVIKNRLQWGMDENLMSTDNGSHQLISFHWDNSDFIFLKKGNQGGDDPSNPILFAEVNWKLIDLHSPKAELFVIRCPLFIDHRIQRSYLAS